jgi:hypothetical protein
VSSLDEDVILPPAVLAVAHYILAVKLATVASVPVSQELLANASLADSFISRQAMDPKPVTGGLPRSDAYEATTSISVL